jgi:hypothetical protein
VVAVVVALHDWVVLACVDRMDHNVENSLSPCNRLGLHEVTFSEHKTVSNGVACAGLYLPAKREMGADTSWCEAFVTH